MAVIPLDKGFETEVDDVHVKDLSGFRWYVIQSNRSSPYVALYRSQKWNPDIVLLHRVIMSLKLGRPIHDYELVDHKDRNTFNNLESNLRLATRSQNSQNQQKRSKNKSGFKGVDRLKSGRYRAQITVDWLYKYLGTHETAEDAARAYDKAARKYHKEFAVLNFPDEPFE